MSRQAPATPICADASFANVTLREYGCTRCQAFHRQPDPIYDEHLMWQSKHGWYEVDAYAAIVQAHAVAKAKSQS